MVFLVSASSRLFFCLVEANHNENNDVNQNEPAVPEPSADSTSKARKKSRRPDSPAPFPLSLWRLVESSGDSWTSSGSSTTNLPVEVAEVEYHLPLNRNGATFAGGKSENALSTKRRSSDCANGDAQEKAVSLSALEAKAGTSHDVESGPHRLGSNGARPKHNHVSISLECFI